MSRESGPRRPRRIRAIRLIAWREGGYRQQRSWPDFIPVTALTRLLKNTNKFGVTAAGRLVGGRKGGKDW